jgi:hypothetical protein
MIDTLIHISGLFFLSVGFIFALLWAIGVVEIDVKIGSGERCIILCF